MTKVDAFLINQILVTRVTFSLNLSSYTYTFSSLDSLRQIVVVTKTFAGYNYNIVFEYDNQKEVSSSSITSISNQTMIYRFVSVHGPSITISELPATYNNVTRPFTLEVMEIIS